MIAFLIVAAAVVVTSQACLTAALIISKPRKY